MILFLAFEMIRCRHSLMPERKIAVRQAPATANRAFAGRVDERRSPFSWHRG